MFGQHQRTLPPCGLIGWSTRTWEKHKLAWRICFPFVDTPSSHNYAPDSQTPSENELKEATQGRSNGDQGWMQVGSSGLDYLCQCLSLFLWDEWHPLAVLESCLSFFLSNHRNRVGGVRNGKWQMIPMIWKKTPQFLQIISPTVWLNKWWYQLLMQLPGSYSQDTVLQLKLHWGEYLCNTRLWLF